MAAPHTMFNVKIGGARRCAAQSCSLDRVLNVKKAAGVSFNDAVLAMCSGALRYYLIEQNALPDAPLVAMIPMSLRSKEEADAGGNLVGSILSSLATDIEDPAERMAAISVSMRGNKEVFKQLPRAAGARVIGTEHGSADARRLSLVSSRLPRRRSTSSSRMCPDYAGADVLRRRTVDGSYPLSALPEGQALNITLVNNAGNLDFGLVGCRRSVPAPAATARAPGVLAQGSGSRGRDLGSVPKTQRGDCCCIASATVCWKS